MKRLTYISAISADCNHCITSCHDKRKPVKVYMPDMAYSRAFESYALKEIPTSLRWTKTAKAAI
jgi:hypothetical protein